MDEISFRRPPVMAPWGCAKAGSVFSEVCSFPLTNWELPLIFGPLPRPRRGKNLILPWVWPQPALLINIPSCFSPATKEKGSKVRGQQQRLCQEQTTAGEAVPARAESVPDVFLSVQFPRWDQSARGGLPSNLPLPGTCKWVGLLCFVSSPVAPKRYSIFKVKSPTPLLIPSSREHCEGTLEFGSK